MVEAIATRLEAMAKKGNAKSTATWDRCKKIIHLNVTGCCIWWVLQSEQHSKPIFVIDASFIKNKTPVAKAGKFRGSKQENQMYAEYHVWMLSSFLMGTLAEENVLHWRTVPYSKSVATQVGECWTQQLS